MHNSKTNRASAGSDSLIFELGKEEEEKQPSLAVLLLLSLRTKTLVVLLLLFVISTAVILAILLGVLPQSFTRIESELAKDAALRVSRHVHEEANAIALKLLDYAIWDDTYNAFVNYTEGNADEYWNNNMNCDYMVGVLKQNFAVAYSASTGAMLKYSACDSVTKQTIELPSLFANISQTHPILRDMQTSVSKRFAGYVVHNGSFIFLASAPIQNNAEQAVGGIFGVFLFARYFTPSFVKSLSDKAQLCTSMYTPSADMYKSYESVIQQSPGTTFNITDPDGMQNNSPIDIQVITLNDASKLANRQCWKIPLNSASGASNEERIAAWQVYQDIFGNKNMLIRLDTNRNIYNLAVQSFAIACGSVGGVSIILGIIILIFIELFVLRVILSLSSYVKSIAETNNFNARIPKTGHDEISTMTGHINSMLRALDLSQQKIKDHNYKLQQLLQRTGIEEQKSRSIMNAIPDFIVTVNQKDGTILNANTAFQQAFKLSAQELTDHPFNFQQLLPTMSHAQEMIVEFEHLAQTQSHISIDLQTKLGVSIPVLLSTSKSKIYTEQTGKEVDAFVVVCRNMSEQKQMAQNFEMQQQEIALLQRQVEFENMLRTPALRNAFKEYCIKEHSEENIMFIEDVEEYTGLKMAHERATRATEIINKYMKEDSPFQLNISNSIKEAESFNLENNYGQIDLFDHLEQAVRMNIMNDTFARFMKTHPAYTKKASNNKLLKMQETSGSYLLLSPRPKLELPEQSQEQSK